MTTNPEEHDFIAQVCAEDAAVRAPKRLSDDPAVRLAECRGEMAAQVKTCSEACDRGLPILPVVFDEEAERAKFEEACLSGADVNRHRRKDGLYLLPSSREKWQGWLACAKSKAEGK